MLIAISFVLWIKYSEYKFQVSINNSMDEFRNEIQKNVFNEKEYFTHELIGAQGQIIFTYNSIFKSSLKKFSEFSNIEINNISNVLKYIPNDTLAMALIDQPEEVVQTFLKGMSSRAAEMVQDEIAFISPQVKN